MKRCLGVALFALTAPAYAHIGFAANDLYAGMLHPLLHLSTLLPLIALALWLAGQPVARLPRHALAFVLAAGIGIGLGLGVGQAPAGQALLLMLSVALGLLAATRARLPLPLALIAPAAVGLLEGWDNLAQVRGELRDPWLFCVGLSLTFGLSQLHLLPLLQGRTQLWLTTGVRVLGSWIATAAVLVMALNLLPSSG